MRQPTTSSQHPELELYSTASTPSGVARADCHMPYTWVGGVKVSDHHIHSPLFDINNACQTCPAAPARASRLLN